MPCRFFWQVRDKLVNIIFLLSVILKGIGAVLEILLQILITRGLGLDGYGTYSTWINAADLVFWILFSALTKCNTFYLSLPDVSIKKFKRQYYSRYVLPVLGAAALLALGLGKSSYCIVILITLLELKTLDQSSTLMAQRHQVFSLVGEYILGRLILVLGLLMLQKAGGLTLAALLVLYAFQYIVIILMFTVFQRLKIPTSKDFSDEVSLKKWGSYQRADFFQAMIGQMPVLLQFFFSGAFEAGVVSIVLTVKKMINFISGPTAKVFLPEFSRLYRNGQTDKIRESFASIMRIQMLFAGPLSVVLIGYPHVVLRILADDLLAYTSLFILCSVVFIVTATLGPCSGVLQMTGNENKDNLFREVAILAMVVVMILLRGDKLFVLYGLCAQTALEAIGKYCYVCYWMKLPPVKLTTYASWWVCPVAAIAATYALHLENSLLCMLIAAVAVFGIGLAAELRTEGGLMKMLGRK